MRLLLFLPLFVAILLAYGTFSKVFAQACVSSDRHQGLISGTSLSGLFGNPTGQCVIDPKAAYANFKVPDYNELKSVFFTQNTTANKMTVSTTGTPNCPGGLSTGSVYLRNMTFPSNSIVNVQCQSTRFDDAGANGPFAVAGTTRTVIVFAENHVYIDSNLNYGGSAYGLVIIAKGDVYIAGTVRTINAIIVAEGNIYTTTAGVPITSTVPNSQQLVVNGSIINFAKNSNRIYFNRSLADNSIPAEVVNFQSKFLVLLRGLMTQSFTIQREIGPDEIPSASIFPSPTSIPSPAPSTNPGSTFGNAFCVRNIFNILNVLNISSDTNVPCT